MGEVLTPEGRLVLLLGGLPAILAADLLRPTDGVTTIAECLAMAGLAAGAAVACGIGNQEVRGAR